MSSSNNSSQEESASREASGRLKDAARESRFRFRNIAEYELRRELKEKALEKCDTPIKNFAECSSEKGLMVIFSCQSLFRKINECMQVHNGEEAWQKYKAENEEYLEKRARGIKN